MKLNEIKVKEWYLSTYPEDTCGEDLLEEITFQDVLNGLKHNIDIYKILFRRTELGDSVIRDLVLDKLIELVNKSKEII